MEREEAYSVMDLRALSCFWVLGKRGTLTGAGNDGGVGSKAELARELGVSRACVTHDLRLPQLAPPVMRRCHSLARATGLWYSPGGSPAVFSERGSKRTRLVALKLVLPLGSPSHVRVPKASYETDSHESSPCLSALPTILGQIGSAGHVYLPWPRGGWVCNHSTSALQRSTQLRLNSTSRRSSATVSSPTGL